MTTYATDIIVPDGKLVKITTYDASSWVFRFRAVGTVNPKHRESIDAMEYICGFSKCELFLLREVYRHTEEENNLTLRPRTYVPAERAKLRTATPLWIKKGLLTRLKREYYMVNPWFLPPKQEQQKVMDYWRALNP